MTTKEPIRKVMFDNRKKTLTIKTRHDEMKTGSGEASIKYGHNENVAVLTEMGIKEVVKDLNKQKTNLQLEHKRVSGQLDKIKDINVDEEFIAQMKAFTAMKQKAQLLEHKENAELMITTIGKQLLEIKDAVGKNIKW